MPQLTSLTAEALVEVATTPQDFIATNKQMPRLRSNFTIAQDKAPLRAPKLTAEALLDRCLGSEDERPTIPPQEFEAPKTKLIERLDLPPIAEVLKNRRLWADKQPNRYSISSSNVKKLLVPLRSPNVSAAPSYASAFSSMEARNEAAFGVKEAPNAYTVLLDRVAAYPVEHGRDHDYDASASFEADASPRSNETSSRCRALLAGTVQRYLQAGGL